MIINRQKFHDGYRATWGSLRASQVMAIEHLLTKFDASVLFDRLSKIACTFGNIKTETGDLYTPCREGNYLHGDFASQLRQLYNYYSSHNRGALKTIFPNGLDEIINFIGRGEVQTTHDYNYMKFFKAIKYQFGVDIMKEPDKMMDDDISFMVMELGLNVREYSYTGKILSDYFNDNTEDYSLEKRFIGYRNMVGYLITPRRTINGKDKYQLIGNDSIKFYNILEFE